MTPILAPPVFGASLLHADQFSDEIWEPCAGFVRC